MTEKPWKRLFPTILDDRAKETPDRVYAVVPKTGKISDGYNDISYQQIANATNKVSWWLEEEIGKSTTFDTIAYIGPPGDLRYMLLVLAGTKLGWKTLLPLPSNSREAHIELLRSTDCKVIISPKGMEKAWDPVRESMPHLKTLNIASFNDLINDKHVKPYPYTKTYYEGKNDPLLVTHTSGTTGTPKPYIYTHYMTVAFYRERQASKPSNPPATLLFAHARVLNPVPPSWLFGLAMILHLPLGDECIPVLLPADAPHPMTAAYLDVVHRTVPLDGGVYMPDTLVQLSKNPDYLASMRNAGLKFVIFSGAPLAKATGDVFAQFLKVQALMGSSEMGSYATCEADQDDWQYYRFQEDSGFEFEGFEEGEGLYELVVKRNVDEEKKQNIFCLFPELTEFRTKDLWREHAVKKGLWLYSGRVDDFVKLGSMTKFSAAGLEGMLEREPGVRGVLMAGSEKPAPFLLVEMEGDSDAGQNPKKSEELINAIWPTIDDANKGFSEEIRIQRELIMFTKPGKPMIRTGKATVKRRETLAVYEEEIEDLYTRFAAKSHGK